MDAPQLSSVWSLLLHRHPTKTDLPPERTPKSSTIGSAAINQHEWSRTRQELSPIIASSAISTPSILHQFGQKEVCLLQGECSIYIFFFLLCQVTIKNEVPPWRGCILYNVSMSGSVIMCSVQLPAFVSRSEVRI